jgi:hypothetical protein
MVISPIKDEMKANGIRLSIFGKYNAERIECVQARVSTPSAAIATTVLSNHDLLVDEFWARIYSDLLTGDQPRLTIDFKRFTTQLLRLYSLVEMMN